jgi:hypothetical protein
MAAWTGERDRGAPCINRRRPPWGGGGAVHGDISLGRLAAGGAREDGGGKEGRAASEQLPSIDPVEWVAVTTPES